MSMIIVAVGIYRMVDRGSILFCGGDSYHRLVWLKGLWMGPRSPCFSASYALIQLVEVVPRLGRYTGHSGFEG